MGGLLIGLSTFQGEFDFGVPQFRFVLEPVLLRRRRLGRPRLRPPLDRPRRRPRRRRLLHRDPRRHRADRRTRSSARALPHFPLYLAEAGCVELAGAGSRPPAAALRRRLRPCDRNRRLRRRMGVVADRDADPLELGPLPEALIVAIVAGVAGRPGGRAARPARSTGSFPGRAVARPIPIVALLAIMGIVRRRPLDHRSRRTSRPTCTLHDVAPRPQARGRATVRIDPPQAAEDPAWLNVTAWQGGAWSSTSWPRRATASTAPPSRSRSTATGRRRSGSSAAARSSASRSTCRATRRSPGPRECRRSGISPALRQRPPAPPARAEARRPGWLKTAAPARRPRPRARASWRPRLGPRPRRAARPREPPPAPDARAPPAADLRFPRAPPRP